ncbi:dihydrofolate reductase [Geitlerinema sp. P-1104]|uniref:phosphoglycerate dehydrogenase n=1 Tax=Geitlerinema sp. P-1104 TaxID=2546230 RepID=UPI0014778549|nr:phosphoglycerate dehydrogenase [Geitlerinema sp. P-1104]NMG59560.1 dihydrofolate reductase [Geitlerinema sp. P-1104]
MTQRVLITCPHLQRTINLYRQRFAKLGIEIEVPELVQQLSEAELLDIIDRFDGVIAGDDPFTAKVLEKGKRLKVVAKWGIGMDAIDREAAEKLGIQTCNTPDVFGDEVADVIIGYIILLARQLHALDRSVREGGWAKIQGRSLKGKTLGVIGVGSIGRAVVRRAIAMGMLVVGYDVRPLDEAFLEETGIKPTSLDELLSISDFISLSCNLTPKNHHLISHPEFTKMKKGVYIVNTSRGALIDEVALIEGLKTRKVVGAALDVFEEEPLPLDSPLRTFEHCIFGTHNSSNTQEAVLRTNEMAIQNLLNALEVVK